MTVNTKIHLPLHVRTDDVLKVIGKVVGEPYRLGSLGQQVPVRPGENVLDRARVPKPFDPSLPAGPDNQWLALFEHNGKSLRAIPVDMTFGHMHFTDVGGQSHEWSWHQEDEAGRCKTLGPGAHALAVAVGRRLVRFFGGDIVYSDYSDETDYRVAARRARFPGPQPTQSGDDRFYQFQNALAAEPLLAAAELKQAVKLMGERACEKALLEKLEIVERARRMDQVFAAAEGGSLRVRL